MLLAIGLWTFARAFVHGVAAVTLENLALRHQLVVLQRSVPRPKLHRRRPRLLGVFLAAMEKLAVHLGHRPARDRPRLTPPGLSALLALEVAVNSPRPSADRCGDPSAHPPHGR